MTWVHTCVFGVVPPGSDLTVGLLHIPEYLKEDE